MKELSSHRKPIRDKVKDSCESHVSMSSNENNSNYVDCTNIFQPSRIKAQLHRNKEHQVGRIPGKSIELIGTVSALLLRDLVSKSVALAGEEISNNDKEVPYRNGSSNSGNAKKSRTFKAVVNTNHAVVTMKNIQKAIQDNPNFLCLQQVVDDVTEDRALYVPPKKKRRKHIGLERVAPALGVDEVTNTTTTVESNNCQRNIPPQQKCKTRSDLPFDEGVAVANASGFSSGSVMTRSILGDDDDYD